MNSTKVKQCILKVLKTDDRLWNEDKTELNQTLLFDLIEKVDKSIINLLFQDKELKDTFFVEINDIYVFKTNDFRFFMEENKVDNSYTIYTRKIGLSNGTRFLDDTRDVVLNFPYKDCVLEGGQSTAEGIDTYFDYSNQTKEYQQKQAKRKEIFFNEILAKDEIDRLFEPKALVNWKRFTKNGEEELKELERDEDGTIKENLIIKGNNLIALHSLKKQFAGKIKLIYIDPPYNTGNDDFKYNDNFNHSTWLTFMKNRLEVAKELLRGSGVIIIECDDKEMAYLKVLMDEIFNRNNFINSITIESSTPSGLKLAHKQKTIIKTKDLLLVFAIDAKNIKIKPSYRKQTEWDVHYNYFFDGKTLKKFRDVIIENKIYSSATAPKDYELSNKTFFKFCLKNRDYIFQTGKEMPPDIRKLTLLPKNKDKVIPYGDGQFGLNGRRLSPLSKSIYTISGENGEEEAIVKLNCDIWTDLDFNNTQNEGGVSLPSGKKPEALLYRIIEMFTEKGDIVLDYHLGSGTTCAVAHKMGRQYIGVEQLDYGDNDSVKRLQEVIAGDQSGISKIINWRGGGDFVYVELAKWNEKAKDEILKKESLSELIKFFDEMYEKYFLNYNLKVKEFKEKVINEENFKNLSLNEQKNMFLTMLDINQMYVQKSEMADKKFGIDEKDQRLTLKFYNGEK